jgi:ribulose-phosphate 3-epimerase
LLLTAPAGGGSFDEHAFTRLSERPVGMYAIVDGKIVPEHFSRLEELNVDLAVVGAALFTDGEAEERSKAFSKMLRSLAS